MVGLDCGYRSIHLSRSSFPVKDFVGGRCCWGIPFSRLQDGSNQRSFSFRECFGPSDERLAILRCNQDVARCLDLPILMFLQVERKGYGSHSGCGNRACVTAVLHLRNRFKETGLPYLVMHDYTLVVQVMPQVATH